MPDEVIPTNEQAVPDLPSGTAAEVVPPTAPINVEANSGINVPEPTIEKKILTLAAFTTRIQNLSLQDFIKRQEGDSADLAETKQQALEVLTIDPETDNALTRVEKQLNLFLLSGLQGLATVFGTPTEVYDEKVAYKPQLLMVFKERVINPDDLPLRIYKLEKEISFRFMGDNVPTTKDDLDALKAKIIEKFVGFKWTVSPIYSYNYRDKANGYRLSISAERDLAVELITKVVSLQNHEFDEQWLGETKHNKGTPRTATYFGEEVQLPFRGRYGDVYLHTATYLQNGIKPKVLIDPFIYFNEQQE